MPPSPTKRPPGPTSLPTSTAILVHDESDQQRPHPTLANPAAALSSALRPSADSLHARGGSPHSLHAFTSNAPSSLGLTNLVAMDLSVPAPEIEVSEPSSTDASSSSTSRDPALDSPTSTHTSSSGASNRAKRQRKELDKGYDGDTIRERVSADLHLKLPPRNRDPRDYLTGAFEKRSRTRHH